MSTSSNYPRSVQIQVHLDAVAENYQTMRSAAGSKAFAVVKADAYGHGADAVVSYLSNIADGFAVVTVGEAISIRDAGVTQPILVMQGPQDSDDMDAVFEHGLWPALHDDAQIDMVLAHRNAIDIEPWLKVDTGMGRLGVSVDRAKQLLSRDQLRWRGVMSHLASADLLSSSQTGIQAERLLDIVRGRGIESSLANSAGVLGWECTLTQWARIGIAMYGDNPLQAESEQLADLKPAMTVQAPIVSVKLLPGGHSVGYCQTYVCPEDMLVAYLGIGYGDGIPRVLDASADVSVRGVRCPIIGRVSMDSICVDCRPLLELGEEAPNLSEWVTIWGRGDEQQQGSAQGSVPGPKKGGLASDSRLESQPVSRLAQAAGTISYELLTGIAGRRRYTD